MRQKKILGLIILGAFLMSALFGCGVNTTTQNEDKLKVGFIYNGEAADFGWSYAIEQGRKYINENMNNIETDYTVALESNPEDVKAAMIKYASEGYDIIFSTSAGYLDIAKEVKAQYPDVSIVHAQATKADGITTIMPKYYESKYLAGMAAGLMTKTNVIGYISSYKFPGSVLWVNSFAQGVKDVNPDAKVYLKWASTWDDPETERNDALDMISTYDADVLAGEQNSPTIPQVAENNDRFAVGAYADMSSFAPNAVLTSPVLNWGPFFKKIIDEKVAGNLKEDLYWSSMSESVGDVKLTDIAPFGAMVPADVKDKIMSKRSQIIDGSFTPFPQISTVEDINNIKLLDSIIELE